MEKELLHLQQTNLLYRETAENELLLKEQIRSLQESLQRYKDQCQTMPYLEVLKPNVCLRIFKVKLNLFHDLKGELKKTSAHLREWENMAERLFDASSLAQVQTQVEDMRRKELKLVEDLGNLQIELNSLNR